MIDFSPIAGRTLLNLSAGRRFPCASGVIDAQTDVSSRMGFGPNSRGDGLPAFATVTAVFSGGAQ